jgi:hypothetical protein
VSESKSREPEGHDDCPACRGPSADQNAGPSRHQLSRRSALRLAAGAGAALVVAPHVRAEPRRVGIAAARALAAPRPEWPIPPIVTRAAWGADEAIRHGGQEYDTVIEKIVIHHTATPSNPADPAAALRGVYTHAVTAGGYIDLQYNWMIDHNVRIYEGRWASDYPPGVAHTGEANGANVRGGHAEAHNSRTIGVCFIGTYTNAMPPDVAIEALVQLLAWKCARWGIDPMGSGAYANATGGVSGLWNITSHRETKNAIGDATTCPGDPLISLLPQIRERVAARLRDGSTGYWIASGEGRLFTFGQVPDHGDTRRLGIPAQIMGITGHPSGQGYWTYGIDGGVFSFGAAQFFGSTGGMRLNRPVIGMAGVPDGNGYWLVASDGGVFSFGSAQFYGSTGALRLNSPVIGMCPAPGGGGYWLYARDGGIFSFGNAQFYGSTGAIRLNKPIVAMAARPQADGYWLIAEDGGVFAFGGAQFHGSTGGIRLNSPVIGAIATTTGNGYMLLARDGGVFSFGDAPFYGSAAGLVAGNAVGFAGRLRP